MIDVSCRAMNEKWSKKNGDGERRRVTHIHKKTISTEGDHQSNANILSAKSTQVEKYWPGGTADADSLL